MPGLTPCGLIHQDQLSVSGPPVLTVTSSYNNITPSQANAPVPPIVLCLCACHHVITTTDNYPDPGIHHNLESLPPSPSAYSLTPGSSRHPHLMSGSSYPPKIPLLVSIIVASLKLKTLKNIDKSVCQLWSNLSKWTRFFLLNNHCMYTRLP